MPQHWDGIEDSSVQAPAVWLYRLRRGSTTTTSGGEASANNGTTTTKSAAPANNNNNAANNATSNFWKPMRKIDCQALNRAYEEMITSTSGTTAPAAEADTTASSGSTTTDSSAPQPNKKQHIVYTEGGRSTADLVTNILRYNYIRGGPDRELCNAVWFIRGEEKNTSDNSNNNNSSSKHRLHPILDNADTVQIETLYQKAAVATSSLGQGIASLLSEPPTPLPSGDGKIQIFKSGDVLTIRKITGTSWFPQTQILQRGYGEYSIVGEEIECALGPVGHVIYIVHGIGEAFFSRHDIKVSGLVDQINTAQLELNKKQWTTYQKHCETFKKYASSTTNKAGNATTATTGTNAQPPVPPKRIELIPIEWYHDMHDSNTCVMKSLNATTLRTIPALRTIANDVVLDVLMYLTPQFCQTVLNIVTQQICNIYNTFTTIHPDFIHNGGKFSLAGHSLGSVICWDLLSILKEHQQQQSAPLSPSLLSLPPILPPPSPLATTEQANERITSGGGMSVLSDHPDAEMVTTSGNYAAYTPAMEITGTQSNDSNDNADGKSSSSVPHHHHTGSYGPTLLRPMSETLPFVPEHTIFLGSPLGIFLTLRGAHPIFDAMRAIQEGTSASATREAASAETTTIPPLRASPFTLPTTSLYNIFHPSDPVAYRIEPLLMSPDTAENDIPPPLYLTVPGQDVRLHVKALQFGDVVRKSFFEPKKNNNAGSGWGSLLEAALGGPAGASESATTNGPLRFPLGGTTGRVDYCLQPGVIESEYISAVTAHSTYFSNGDIQDFLIGLMASSEKI